MGEVVEGEEARYVYLFSEFDLRLVDLSNSTCNTESEFVYRHAKQEKRTTFIHAVFSHDHSVYVIQSPYDRPGRIGNVLLKIFYPTKSGADDTEIKCPYLKNIQWCVVLRAAAATHKVFLFFVQRNSKPVFLSFDLVENCFDNLSLPPLEKERVKEAFHGRGYFVLGSYIYLFFHNDDSPRLFLFDTTTCTSSEWQENESLMPHCSKLNIPLPLDHTGGIVLSDKLSDGSRIMIAVYCPRKLVAYRLGKGDIDFWPVSHRILGEFYDPLTHCEDFCFHETYLHVTGGGKIFMFDTCPAEPLLICEFKIDFEQELRNQISPSKDMPYSTHIISSRRVRHRGSVCGICLGYMPLNPREHDVTASPSINYNDEDSDEEEEEEEDIN